MSNNKRDFTKPSRREQKLTALNNGISSTFPSGDVIRIDGVGFSKSDFQAKVQLFLGPEFQFGRRENNSDGFDVNDYRIQFSIKYSFDHKVDGDR